MPDKLPSWKFLPVKEYLELAGGAEVAFLGGRRVDWKTSKQTGRLHRKLSTDAIIAHGGDDDDVLLLPNHYFHCLTDPPPFLYSTFMR